MHKTTISKLDDLSDEYMISTAKTMSIFIKHYWVERDRMFKEDNINLRELLTSNFDQYKLSIDNLHKYAYYATEQEVKSTYTRKLHPMEWG